MSNRLRSATILLLATLPCGCMTMLGENGRPVTELDTELVIQLLNDIDEIVTNFGWLFPLLGL